MKLPFGAKSLCFDEREEYPLFSYPYPAVLGNVKTKRNMQQVIEFENSAKQQPITSVVSTLCAGYLVYRMNKSEKKQKGGKA